MEKRFEKIGIIYNPDIKEAKNLAKKINEKLKNSAVFPIDNLKKDIDLAVIIGGDGTFLRVSRFYSRTNIPLLGFNVGRLGYLTQAHPDEIDIVLDKLKENDYFVENRTMLKALDYTALNDIVIKGLNCART